MMPNAAAVGLKFGALNSVRLVALKASMRNLKLIRSLNSVFLMSNASRLLEPSGRKLPKMRARDCSGQTPGGIQVLSPHKKGSRSAASPGWLERRQPDLIAGSAPGPQVQGASDQRADPMPCDVTDRSRHWIRAIFR